MLPEDVPVPLLPRRQRGPRPAEGRRHQSRLRQLRPQAGRRADLPELRNHLRQGELVHLYEYVTLNIATYNLSFLLQTDTIKYKYEN